MKPEIYNNPHYINLVQHSKSMLNTNMLAMFKENPKRGEEFSITSGPLQLDFSKNIINDTTISNLCKFAAEIGLGEKIAAMFAGEKINATENRAVLHTELRKPRADMRADVAETLINMERAVRKIRNKQWLGYSDKAITDIVNIGIGGSHLGPQMVVSALESEINIIKPHYIANIDPADAMQVLNKLNPETTLFIISSKTFTTLETLENAKTALSWLKNAGCKNEHSKRHFLAITNAYDKACTFGVARENIYTFCDWVGGRYSLWSPIGISIAISLGMETFDALLAGAHSIDQHFISREFSENIPVILALLGFWYQKFWHVETQAVLPYAHNLRFLVDYLQQLDMESNGKRNNLATGEVLDENSGAIIWGGVGTNGQHAFHQLLHQGTRFVPVDFILPLQSQYADFAPQQSILVANCLAQAQGLMQGKTISELTAETEKETAAHKVLPGNRPSNIITFDKIDAYSLGALIATYEHKVFVQGALYGVNSFDQWGVELGKKLANNLIADIKAERIPSYLDSSTANLLKRYLSVKN